MTTFVIVALVAWVLGGICGALSVVALSAIFAAGPDEHSASDDPTEGH